jgi:hypothetical protein
MLRSRLCFGLLALTLLLWSPVADATVVIRLGLPEMTRVSDVIALGRVARQTASWDQSGHRILTTVELEVERVLKGQADPATGRVAFIRMGGVVNGIGQKVFGEPAFHDGETVLVFLRRLPAPEGVSSFPLLRVTGMAQGKLAVHVDAQGIRRVGADLSGLSLVNHAPTGAADSPGRVLLTPRASLSAQPLEEVLEVVQRTLKDAATSATVGQPRNTTP